MSKDIRYIFFGTPRFASVVLDTYMRECALPVALVCNPDRPVGRKKIITAPATKRLLLDAGYEGDILQPEKITDELLEELRRYDADVFIVAAYTHILPDPLLSIPRFGTIGVHPSLLPLYRGASPIQSAILDGAPTGISLYLIDAKMDHGPVLAVRELAEPIDDFTYLSLEETLARAGGELLIETLPLHVSRDIVAVPQDHDAATFTKKFKTEDGFVSEEDLARAGSGDTELAIKIDRMIRAFAQEPGVYTVKDGKRIKLLEARVEDGKLVLEVIQKEGERPIRI